MPDDASDHGRLALFFARRTWLLVAVVTIAAFFLRFRGLGDDWINPDEGIYYSMLSWTHFSDFWAECAGNAHPPLFYLLLRGMASIGGMPDYVWFRAVALVFGTLAVPAAWLFTSSAVGRGLVGQVAGLLSACVIAFSPGMIQLSRIIRPYMMLLAALTFAGWFLVSWLRDGRRRDLVGYVATIWIALVTHYAAFLVFGAFSLVILLHVGLKRLDRRTVIDGLVAHTVPIATITALYFLHLRPRLIGSALAKQALGGWLRGHMIQDLSGYWLNLLGVMAYVSGEALAGLATVAFFAGIGFAIWRRKLSVWALPLSLYAAAAFAATVHKYPFGCSRHSSYLASFLLLPVTWLAARALTTNMATAIAAIVLCGVSFVQRPVPNTNRSEAVVTSLLGGRHTATYVFQETTLKRVDLASAARLISFLQTPGIVIMPQEAYYTLVPLLRRQRESADWSDEVKLHTFPWYARTVIVPDAWQLVLDEAERGHVDHLETMLRMAARRLPRLKVLEQTDAIFIFAGWTLTTGNLLLTEEAARPPNARLVKNLYYVRGLMTFQLNVRRWLATRRKAK